MVRNEECLLVLPADREVKDDDPERVSVDLDRLRREVDRPAEWHQMFDETARLMRDHYWRADMNGVDWDAAAARYRPLVSRLASHDELVDLRWEFNGELGSSHAYVLPPDSPPSPDKRLGLLGADLRRNDRGAWWIERILPGESSDPRARSPLRAAGVAVGPGDVIAEVAGQAVPVDLGPAALLGGAADRIVELTVRPADGAPARRVAVLPLADEEPLRYQDWVAGCRAHVEEHGNGRLGYMPDGSRPTISAGTVRRRLTPSRRRADRSLSWPTSGRARTGTSWRRWPRSCMSGRSSANGPGAEWSASTAGSPWWMARR